MSHRIRQSSTSVVVFWIVVILSLPLIVSMVGAWLGKALPGLGGIGPFITAGLVLCSGLWSLILLAGMVLVAPSTALGEYFWLYAPIVTAASLGVGLAASSDVGWAASVGYTLIGGWGLYGVAIALHFIVKKFTSWSSR